MERPRQRCRGGYGTRETIELAQLKRDFYYCSPFYLDIAAFFLLTYDPFMAFWLWLIFLGVLAVSFFSPYLLSYLYTAA